MQYTAVGHDEVAELLIKKGSANINLMDNFKDTPLHESAYHGKVTKQIQ